MINDQINRKLELLGQSAVKYFFRASLLMIHRFQTSQMFVALLTATLIATFSSATTNYQDTSLNVLNQQNAKKQGHFQHIRKLSTAPDFDKAKKLAENLANLIYQRFEFNNSQTVQFFQEAMNIPNYGWDIMKYKIAKKIVEGDSSFLMIFGGSSVTAGHDNYYNQSYPAVFERRMAPIFDALGIKLLVHNIAQGANNCRPALNCYNAMGGQNADWIGWEQSFNCGKAKDVFEQVARMAYWNGGVAHYSASGAFLPNGCAPSTDKLYWTHENWTPELEGITSRYALTPEAVALHKDTQMRWFNDGNAVSRFTSVYGPLYMGVGPHGFSVWGHSSTLCNNGTGCTAIDVKGECHEKGGPHWMVQETAWYASSPTKKGREWHPSAGMHLLRAEIMAYTYVHIVVDAVLAVERNLTMGTSKEAAAKYYQQELDLLRIPIPEKALYLQAEESRHPPLCYTDYQPHHNPEGLLSRMVVGNHSGWSYVTKLGSWTEGDGAYGYKDYRPFYEAKGAGLEIYVRVIGVRSNSLKVCGYSTKESLKHALFFLDPNVTLPFRHNATDPHIEGSADEYVPTAGRVQVMKRRYVQDECTQLMEVPNGDSILTIRTDPNHPTHTSSLSHIVIF